MASREAMCVVPVKPLMRDTDWTDLMTRDSDTILRYDPGLRDVIGQICWGVSWTKLLNLSLSLGNPRLKVLREPDEIIRPRQRSGKQAKRTVAVRGEWWLWVYVAHWRILNGEQLMASSSSSYRKKTGAFAVLQGQKLENLRIKPRTYSTQIDFDLGCTLEIRRTTASSKDEMWLLYEPDDYVLSLRGDGVIEREPASSIDTRMTIAGTARGGLALLPRQSR
jgi:hypothetical protein